MKNISADLLEEDDGNWLISFLANGCIYHVSSFQLSNAAQQSVHLTALRRWLAVSWFIIIALLVVIAFLIGGR